MTTLPRLRPGTTGRRSAGERRARERRVLWVGLALSVLLHLLLIPLASRWLEPTPREPVSAMDSLVVEPTRAMRAVELAVRPDAAVPDRPAEPAPPPDRRREVVVRVEPTPDVAVEPVERRSAAERLAPRVVDPRLWRPMIVLPREPTLAEVQDRVAAAVEMLSDSALADAERALRATDWTVEDADGGRWGISPGKLHLGNLTLPLPLFFPTDMAAERQQAYWFELDTQLERAQFLDSFDSRVRAIRERRERERAEQRDQRGG